MIKRNEIKLNSTQISTVNELLDNIVRTQSKLNLTKGEHYQNLKTIQHNKEKTNLEPVSMSSKYIKLLSTMDTRNSYLQSILNSLIEIENCIDGNCQNTYSWNGNANNNLSNTVSNNNIANDLSNNNAENCYDCEKECEDCQNCNHCNSCESCYNCHNNNSNDCFDSKLNSLLEEVIQELKDDILNNQQSSESETSIDSENKSDVIENESDLIPDNTEIKGSDIETENLINSNEIVSDNLLSASKQDELRIYPDNLEKHEPKTLEETQINDNTRAYTKEKSNSIFEHNKRYYAENENNAVVNENEYENNKSLTA